MSGYEISKMRKRNVSWSSSPPSSYRFKRAIVLAKQGGSTSPTPPPPPPWEEEDGDRWKEVMKAVAVSKELLQLLRSAWEQRSVRSSLFSALRLELERALVQAAAGEKWSRGERDRIRLAVAAEVRVERRLRRQAERLNRRLGSELAEARAAAERERRARQLAEQSCGECERERQMLQVADVLREERVQMKLSDAKFELEEKNAAVEQLRCELQAYLTAGPTTNHQSDSEEGDDIIITHGRHSPENIQWSDICFNTTING